MINLLMFGLSQAGRAKKVELRAGRRTTEGETGANKFRGESDVAAVSACKPDAGQHEEGR